MEPLPRCGDNCARWAWLVPGFLFGLTAMFRPEYLLVGAAFVVLAAIRVWRAAAGASASPAPRVLLVALVLPIVPWTIRNVVVLDRVVPISTGGGKALYVGTYLPADGEYQRVKAILVERYRTATSTPNSEALERGRPDPALRPGRRARYPDLPRDQRSARSASKTSPSSSAKTPAATWR